MRYLFFIFISLLVGCSDRSSVVGLYADPTPGPEPEAVKYAHVSDSADYYNIRLYDAQGFLLERIVLPDDSLSKEMIRGRIGIKLSTEIPAVQLTSIYGPYRGTSHLLYPIEPDQLPRPVVGKLRLERLYCGGEVPPMTILAVNVSTQQVDMLRILYSVITDPGEYGEIAPDEAYNEEFTPQEAKEFHQQLDFQTAVLYLPAGRYVVYGYAFDRIPMSCYDRSGRLTEVEIQAGRTTTAVLDDQITDSQVPRFR